MAAANNDEEEAERLQAIQQLAEITGTDEGFAHYLLQENDYDLNRALTSYFNSKTRAEEQEIAFQEQELAVQQVLVEDEQELAVQQVLEEEANNSAMARSEANSSAARSEANSSTAWADNDGQAAAADEKPKMPMPTMEDDEQKTVAPADQDSCNSNNHKMEVEKKNKEEMDSNCFNMAKPKDEEKTQQKEKEEIQQGEKSMKNPKKEKEKNNQKKEQKKKQQKEEEEKAGSMVVDREPPRKVARHHSELGEEEEADADVQNRFPTDVTLLSWNIDGLDDRNRPKRFTTVLYIIAKTNPEVIFLQEMVPPLMPQLNELLAPMYNIFVQDPHIGYFCVTLVSKNIKITRTHTIPFAKSAMGRGLVVVEGEWQRLKLKLLNTHLESTTQVSAERKRQFNQCMEQLIFMSADKPSETLAIFGGDLNIRDSEVAPLTPSVQDAWIAAGANAFHRFSWDMKENDNYEGRFGKAKPRSRFDRVYFTGDPCYRVDFRLEGNSRIKGPNCFASDHYAVVCRFLLKNGMNADGSGCSNDNDYTPKLAPLEYVLANNVPEVGTPAGSSAKTSTSKSNAMDTTTEDSENNEEDDSTVLEPTGADKKTAD